MSIELDNADKTLLQLLKLYGPISLSDLAHLIERDKSYVCRRVAGLKQLALVAELHDREDTRHKPLLLTARGISLAKWGYVSQR